MGPYAGVDYNLTLCPLQSRLQHIYHGQPYARVRFIPPSGNLDLASVHQLRSAVFLFLQMKRRSLGEAWPSCSAEWPQECGNFSLENSTVGTLCIVRYSEILHTSVADPDPNPDPSDPYVFGPPGSGSGSISQRYGSGSGSFHHPAKILRKPWFLLF